MRCGSWTARTRSSIDRQADPMALRHPPATALTNKVVRGSLRWTPGQSSPSSCSSPSAIFRGPVNGQADPRATAGLRLHRPVARPIAANPAKMVNPDGSGITVTGWSDPKVTIPMLDS